MMYFSVPLSFVHPRQLALLQLWIRASLTIMFDLNKVAAFHWGDVPVL